MLNRKSEDRYQKTEGRRQNKAVEGKTLKARKAKLNSFKFSGNNDSEEPPVPIPNTEVKLTDAENTCEIPCWEDK